MTRLWASLTLVIGLMSLAPGSAEAASIVPFADDPVCRRHQTLWVFTPIGMGIVDIRFDPRSTGQCAAAGGGSNAPTPFVAGGIGGGAGFDGFPGALWPGFVTSPFALDIENPFELEPDDPLFTGDTLPPGFTGGPGLPPGSEFGSLPNGDIEQTFPGNTSPPLTAVPEPGSIFLLATGLVLTVRRFRRS